MPLIQDIDMILEYRPLYQFLWYEEVINQHSDVRPRAGQWKTYTHGELVVREELRHKTKEVFVIFIQHDGLKSNLCKDRLDARRKFPLVIPVFYTGKIVSDEKSTL